MSFVFNTPGLLGGKSPGTVDTVQAWPLGFVAQAVDPTYGSAEFIYLAGVASTVAGDAVTYRADTGATTLTAAGARGPVAVAVGANVASTFGWYQISGVATVKAGTVAANKPLYATSTAGQLDDAVVSGDKIDGAITITTDGTPSAGFALVGLSRPALNGNG